MSLLSTLNRVATKAVSITAGKEAASVYKDASESIGKASLVAVTETINIGVGVVDTTAAAIPAASSYLKGLGLGVLEEARLIDQVKKFDQLSNDERSELFKQLGAITVVKIKESLKEEEEEKN